MVKSGTVLKHIKYAYVYLWVDVFLIIVLVVLFVMFRDNKYYHGYYGIWAAFFSLLAQNSLVWTKECKMYTTILILDIKLKEALRAFV